MALVMNVESMRPVEQDPAVVAKDDQPVIPEIIEERRKDAEGRVTCVNKYMKGRMLGKGGFAKVFLGVLMPTKQQYALKIVAKSSLLKARAKQKLQTEIKIHRSLRHTHVVRFDRFFEDFDNAYMILELCSNNSMSELMKKRKRLSEPETRYYLLQIISCLQYLHENLVIHRDLKLGNLFLDCDMRIKVGDFGLATKMSHRDERRKTVCGTPNYIAPEILEGKEGHSFEVDIWSTGVIMYTLLIGKPPFESKDVKSTYKRILSNAYSFPDHTPICSNAKKLISQLLQPRPDQRPSLESIINHPFFASYTPTCLPELALRECPTIHQLSEMENVRAVETRYNINTDFGGDENDPNVINRGAPKNHPNGFQIPSDNNSKVMIRKPTEPGFESAKDNVLRQKNVNILPAGNVEVLPVKQSASNPSFASRPQTRSISAGATKKAVLTSNPFIVDPPLPSSERSSSSSGSTTNVTATSSAASISSNKAYTSRPGSVTDRGYTQKFDIFVDGKSTVQSQQPLTARSAPGSQQSSVNVRKTDILDKKSTYGNGSDGKTRRSSSVTVHVDDERRQTHSTQMDQVQMDMEQFTIQEPERKLQKQSYGQKHGDNYATSSARQKQEAWAWDDQKDAFPASVTVQQPGTAAGPSLKSQLNADGGYQNSKAPIGNNAEPMCIGTPPDQIISGGENKKPMGTLETMHEMLNTSFSMIESGFNGNNKQLEHLHESEDEVRTSNDVSKLVAKVWVVRYVDYTSKYGLGFLFNNGSAGVYFNDSTKIVLSADGMVFQYIERRRRDSTSNSEHSSQTHMINSYPPELQKKVTLLRHFRNYLIDQQKSNSSNRGNEDNCSATDTQMNDIATMNMNMNGNQGLIRDGYISEGASTAVKFGSSSVRYLGGSIAPVDSVAAAAAGCSSIGDDEFDMPFLKKWVRTKHAILFRISNRTVQVVFYDRSEVLLSSEARIITFVNKQGFRTEHSLDDVLHSGRLDIAKRLKYTKDIMYRLINTQSKV